jgi:Lactonase, 7-bladed beta-propeller
VNGATSGLVELAGTVLVGLTLAACSGGVSSTNTASASLTYSFGGTVSGLKGAGLVLQNNGTDNLAVAANGTFTFSTSLITGDSYQVSVWVQPNSPYQTCLVTHGDGTVTGAQITGIVVTCIDKTTITDTIGGVVTGVVGSGMTLQNNGGDSLAVESSGTFTFATPLASGMAYSVTVLSPPVGPYQDCTVTNGIGMTGGDNVTNVAVSCKTNPNPTYTIGGTVSGLPSGDVLQLQDNGRDNLKVSANGSFQFAIPIPSGSSYSVTQLQADDQQSQTCTFLNASGLVGDGKVTNVSIHCQANATISVVVSGLVGSGLVLQDNGGDNLAITQNGPATFATALPSDTVYDVTVLAQPTLPSQQCAVSGGMGTLSNSDGPKIAVNCRVITANLYVTNSGSGDFAEMSITTDGALLPLSFSVGTGSNSQPSSVVAGCLNTLYVTSYFPQTGAVRLLGYASTASSSAISLASTTPVGAGSPPAASVVMDFNGASCEPLPLVSYDTTMVRDGDIYNIREGDAYAYLEDTANQRGTLTSAIGGPVTVAGGEGRSGGIPNIAIPAAANIGLSQLDVEYIAVNGASTSERAALISAYSVAPATVATPGALTLVPSGTNPPIPNPTLSGTSLSSLTIAGSIVNGSIAGPGGRLFLYATDRGSNAVYSFGIDSRTGLLSPIQSGGAPILTSTGGGPTAMTIVSDSQSGIEYAYVANGADSTLSTYTINTTSAANQIGVLLPLTGSPTTKLTGGTDPVSIQQLTIGATTFLYVANAGSNNISVFSFTPGTGGVLTPVLGSPFPSGGTTPTSIAIVALPVSVTHE